MIGLDLEFLIDSKQLISPGEPDCPQWDVFVSAFNDSDRVKDVY